MSFAIYSCSYSLNSVRLCQIVLRCFQMSNTQMYTVTTHLHIVRARFLDQRFPASFVYGILWIVGVSYLRSAEIGFNMAVFWCFCGDLPFMRPFLCLFGLLYFLNKTFFKMKTLITCK